MDFCRHSSSFGGSVLGPRYRRPQNYHCVSTVIQCASSSPSGHGGSTSSSWHLVNATSGFIGAVGTVAVLRDVCQKLCDIDRRMGQLEVGMDEVKMMLRNGRYDDG